jgi:hypothetical protein
VAPVWLKVRWQINQPTHLNFHQRTFLFQIDFDTWKNKKKKKRPSKKFHLHFFWTGDINWFDLEKQNLIWGKMRKDRDLSVRRGAARERGVARTVSTGRLTG